MEDCSYRVLPQALADLHFGEEVTVPASCLTCTSASQVFLPLLWHQS